MKHIKNILYIAFLVVLWLPLLQFWTHVVPEKKLSGAYISHEKPALSVKNWFDGTYQQQSDLYWNDTLGFHTTMVGLRNSFCFHVFKQANAQNVVVGKDNFLFEKDYIDAFNGDDYVGMQTIVKTVDEVLALQKELEGQGKTLVVCLAPSKADFFPEKIPNRMRKSITDSTNYKQYSRLLKQAGVNVLDYNAWFLKNKNNSTYPLYPQYGIHWSQYGVVKMTDSLVNFIEKIMKTPLNHLVVDDYMISDRASSLDYDLGNTLNLLGGQLHGYPLCYPYWHWTRDSTLTLPKMTAIADSYYWGPFSLGLQQHCFTGSFWYYNHTSYPESDTKETIVSRKDMQMSLQESGVILLMMTPPSLKKFSWNYIQWCH